MGVQNSPEAGLDEKAVIAAAERALSDIALIRKEIAKVIFGQESVVEQTMLAVLSGGHALLVGVPGLAKTKLVATLGTVLGLSASRIQFTPDLMPSDILGSEVMDQDENGKRSFRFVPGPIFTQLLMADEINRASPRTQSALLQAMQEYHVTVAGARHDRIRCGVRPRTRPYYLAHRCGTIRRVTTIHSQESQTPHRKVRGFSFPGLRKPPTNQESPP